MEPKAHAAQVSQQTPERALKKHRVKLTSPSDAPHGRTDGGEPNHPPEVKKTLFPPEGLDEQVGKQWSFLPVYIFMAVYFCHVSRF